MSYNKKIKKLPLSASHLMLYIVLGAYLSVVVFGIVSGKVEALETANLEVATEEEIRALWTTTNNTEAENADQI